MHSFAELFSLLPQCCDAHHYLLVGQDCAEGRECYNDLRPLGAGYWFSLPYRWKLPLESLIAAHLALMIISIVLSVVAIQRLATLKGKSRSINGAGILSLLAASTAVHIIFLYPTLRYTITDAPGSLLALIGTWLLIITPDNRPSRTLLLLLAGLMLGLAAGIRVFYLIPVIIISITWIAAWFYNRKRKWGDLCFLVILLPVMLQYASSWHRSQRLEYLPPNPGLADWHFKSIPIGYDTVLPGYSISWNGPCEKYTSIQQAINTRDFHSLMCQAAGKLNYYLGSYSYLTYWNPGTGDPVPAFNLRIPASSENSPAKLGLTAKNISEDASESSLKIMKPDVKADGEIFQSLPNHEFETFNITMRVWSPINYQYVTLAIRDHETKETIVESGLILTDKPQWFSLDNYLPTTGMKDIVLGFPYISPDSEKGQKAKAKGWTVNQGYFYLADVQLQIVDLKKMRIWSPWILLFNTLACAVACLFLVQHRRNINSTRWISILFLGASCAVALALAPEQRYAISILIPIWVLFLSWTTLTATHANAD